MNDRNRGDYVALCEREGERVPLMARAWWWQAVSAAAHKEWGAVMARDDSGRVIAAMPYQLTRKWGMGFLLMPQLTQKSYVWVAADADRLSGVQRVLEELKMLCRRERVLMAQVAIRMDNEEIELFEKAGFIGRMRTSLRIEDTADMERVEQGFDRGKRKKIKRAEGIGMTLDENITISDLYDIAQRHYATRGEDMEYSRDMLRDLYEAAQAHGCAKLMGARVGGELASATILLMDGREAYYVVGAFAPEYSRCGSLEWLTRECIRWCGTQGLVYDFEGSDNPKIAAAYSRFGSVSRDYWYGEWHPNILVRKLIHWWLAK